MVVKKSLSTLYTKRFILITISVIVSLNLGATIYVDGLSLSSGDGNSWSSPLNNLSDAIDKYVEGEEIWVKKGVYKIYKSIILKKPITIYGGFLGNEKSFDERKHPTTLYSTIFLSQDGKANLQIIGSSTSEANNIVLDAIQIRGVQEGSAALEIKYTDTSVFLRNCVIADNKVCGLLIEDASPQLMMCEITQNTIDKGYGAGVQIKGKSNPVFRHSVITYNTNLDKFGGGVHVRAEKGYGPEFYSCNIISNQTGHTAGAIYLQLSGRCVLDKCVVVMNKHRQGYFRGGAVYVLGDAKDRGNVEMILRNKTIISDNYAAIEEDNPFYLSGLTAYNAAFSADESTIIDRGLIETPITQVYLNKKDMKAELPDLVFPDMEEGKPQAGKMVKVQFDDYLGTGVYHNLYLPPNWEEGERYPVIMDIPGNGPFEHTWGDRSSGKPESSPMGYGISGGKGCILVGLPMINTETMEHTGWYGDVNATAKYIKRVAVDLCENYGADHSAFFMEGYSRGGCGTPFFSRYDAELNDIWQGWIIYDGSDNCTFMNEAYLKKHHIHNYNEGAFDCETVKKRYERIKGRPTVIINSGYNGEGKFNEFNEMLNNPVEHYVLPYRNHNPYWTLCDIPIRNKVREWLYKTIDEKTGTYTLSGKVSDKKGNPIINIRVQTGLTHFVYTDETGFYSIEGLIEGNRDVIVKKAGNVITTKNININENNMECNFTLTNF